VGDGLKSSVLVQLVTRMAAGSECRPRFESRRCGWPAESARAKYPKRTGI